MAHVTRRCFRGSLCHAITDFKDASDRHFSKRVNVCNFRSKSEKAVSGGFSFTFLFGAFFFDVSFGFFFFFDDVVVVVVVLSKIWARASLTSFPSSSLSAVTSSSAVSDEGSAPSLRLRISGSPSIRLSLIRIFRICPDEVISTI